MTNERVTTPGYTVEALLQAIKFAYVNGGMSQEMLLKYAAELTQVPAQSVERASPAKDGGGQSVDMILFCPKCLTQHIDCIEPRFTDNGQDDTEWTNPPHRSHLCKMCGHIWRPSDVATNGVASIKTRGSADDPTAQPLASQMRPQSVVQGWVLVPVELPKEMAQAAYSKLGYPGGSGMFLQHAWPLMLAAAPSYSDAS